MKGVARFAIAALSIAAAAVGAQEGPRPERVVSLAPHLTELAFSAGAGKLIVATVEHSDSPQAARTIPRIGDAFRIDLERLIAIRPDLVLVWDSGTPVQTIERIRALQFQVEAFSTRNLQDIAATVRRLGSLAGTGTVAEPVAVQFERDIERLRERYRGREKVSIFIQIETRPLYTVNGQHVISEIAALCGADNVFGQLNALAPAIGIEAVIAADPQVIIAVDERASKATEHWRQWKHLTAVKAANLFTLDADELARPTTRLSSGAAAMCRALDTARENLAESSRAATATATP